MINTLLVSVAILLFIALVSAESMKFTTCEPPATQIFEVENIDFDVPTPHPGQNVTITITGKATIDTPGGILTSKIYKASVNLFTYKYDICAITKGGCPIKAGQVVTSTFVQKTPTFAFPGEYVAKSLVADLDDNPLSCTSVDITVVRK
mmetsp:Transcript_10280/g.15033  ORF Transcript_10280/g.15033 Transcript_10280/m.15033 type:complete len:149 (+) Transcript_10280:57-503(+)